MAAIIKTLTSSVCLCWLFSMMVTGMLVYSSSLNSWKQYMTTSHNLSSRLTVRDSLDKIEIQASTVAGDLRDIARNVQVSGVNCRAIFEGDVNETKKALSMKNSASIPLSNSFYLTLTTDCEDFQKERGYIMSPLTEEEEKFPLAYSMLVYKDAEMVERLLRAIYRPQNVYCIHVDGKSPVEFFQTITAIANCFSNVFMSSRRLDVVWGEFTVLEPELVCMEELWRYKKWKYFINLTGQEFPLKTNYELVKILTAYNGAVDVMTTVKRANPKRWKKKSAPQRMKRVKGAVHIVVNRDFVDYILHHSTANALLNWAKTTTFPDETFFAMLNANPHLGIKGTYKGNPEPTATRPFVARFKNWGELPCAGKRVRQICILTTGDLPLLGNATEMFANKFFLQEDRVVIGCLEEKHFNNTRDEYLGTKTFSTAYYENLDFVKNKVE